MAEPNTVSMRRGKSADCVSNPITSETDQYLQGNKERGETVIITAEERKRAYWSPPLSQVSSLNVGLRYGNKEPIITPKIVPIIRWRNRTLVAE